MIDAVSIKRSHIKWRGAVRIIRSIYPPIDLFEDIADPEDWALLMSAEQKTNPRLMETIGNLDLVPLNRRVGGAGASYLMSPFTHVSADRKSRFGNGDYGVLYAGNIFEVALFETIHHHERFMARTQEAPGWTSQFREVVLDIDADLHDLRKEELDRDSYAQCQALAAQLRGADSGGVVYRSVRYQGGECAALFYPDCAGNALQGRHLDYHWNGSSVDYYREPGSGKVVRILRST